MMEELFLVAWGVARTFSEDIGDAVDLLVGDLVDIDTEIQPDFSPDFA